MRGKKESEKRAAGFFLECKRFFEDEENRLSFQGQKCQMTLWSECAKDWTAQIIRAGSFE